MCPNAEREQQVRKFMIFIFLHFCSGRGIKKVNNVSVVPYSLFGRINLYLLDSYLYILLLLLLFIALVNRCYSFRRYFTSAIITPKVRKERNSDKNYRGNPRTRLFSSSFDLTLLLISLLFFFVGLPLSIQSRVAFSAASKGRRTRE